MASIADVKMLLSGDKSGAVTRINKPRGGEIYLFRTNGDIAVRLLERWKQYLFLANVTYVMFAIWVFPAKYQKNVSKADVVLKFSVF